MLRERVDLKLLHEALLVAFADCLSPPDYTAVVETEIVSAENVSTNSSPNNIAFGKNCPTNVT